MPAEPRVTPKMIRKGMAQSIITTAARVPEPPEEWGGYRRRRMRVAIMAGVMFSHGATYKDIRDKLQEKLDEKNAGRVSKQRIEQLVRKGTNFLVDRGYYMEVESK